jgi:hypothetical protein
MIRLDKISGIEYMSLDVFARWMCFAEALSYIEKHAAEMGINDYDLVKPNAIEKYIKERYHAMRYDVEREYERGTI